jgi:hypothetical protein
VPSGSGEAESSPYGSGETGSTPLGSGEVEPNSRRLGEVARVPGLGLLLGSRCSFNRRAIRSRVTARLGQAAWLEELIRG